MPVRVVAGVAVLVLHGTVAAVAMREPRSFAARPVVRLYPSVPRPETRQRPTPLSVPLVRLQTHGPSEYQREQSMGSAALMKRWNPFIAKAAKRFDVPASWIREVMRIESGGRTMAAENARLASSQGALGLMQIQRATYMEMRGQYGLGTDPFNPRDNIFAGAAYLRWLHGKYGYPQMFEAYNDGPGNLDLRRAKGTLLPAETRNYVDVISNALGIKPTPAVVQPSTPTALVVATAATPPTAPTSIKTVPPTVLPIAAASSPALTSAPESQPAASQKSALVAPSVPTGNSCAFTGAGGAPVAIDCMHVTAIQRPREGDDAPGVQAIVAVGDVVQGVRESVEEARAIVESHGGHILTPPLTAITLR